jgi:paraquat-inducible protein B
MLANEPEISLPNEPGSPRAAWLFRANEPANEPERRDRERDHSGPRRFLPAPPGGAPPVRSRPPATAAAAALAFAAAWLTPPAPPALAQQQEGPIGRAVERAGELVGLNQEDPEGAARTGIRGGVPFLVRFEGSVGALQAGAPVDVLGMRMGTVREVRATFDPAAANFDVPVTFELDPAPFVAAGEEGEAAAEKVRAAVDAMVRRGLRARIGTFRPLSGDMLLRLDLEPGTPPAELKREGPLPEVPAAQAQAVGIGAQLDGVLARLNALPLEQAVTDLQAAAASAKRFVESPEVAEAMARLKAVAALLEQRAGPLMARLDEATRSATSLAGRADTALAGTNRLLDDSQGLPDQMERLLRELTGVTRSARLLIDQLERRPDALLRGRAGDGS